ncbi:twin-arginine translocation pathway signal [Rhizobiaceae bacterium BDR2-2]|uniref:Twin-arginine translocation pathway signal n=1 Tax=Ectorhizobium quercum TaxID=2965071 RepID=A0AAE3STX8_9HYPH|nr:twin-arginine translocation pathway signal [Ectorhizobium quercum]MCX8996650.1 twin-arginine translocation pathway signal [Ectorhizobium quercum]
MKRTLIAAALAFSPVLALPGPPAFAQNASGCAATETMRGGRNNYIANAPAVENLGTGFVVSGTVREAGTCAPLANVRVQIWTATERGGEREPTNRGSVMTDAQGNFRLETSPIVPQFGQAHIHVAFDDPGYETLFLRPVLQSRNDTSIVVDFNLAPTGGDAPKS